MTPGRRLLCAVLAALGAVLVATAASARLGPVTASYGQWNLRRDVDLMTDRAVCLATYRGNTGVQLFRDALDLKFSERPVAYWYRIDDQPVSGKIAASDSDRRVRVISFRGAPFNQLVNARRLRLRLVSQRFSALHVSEFDLDLTGISGAYSAVYYCR